MAQFFSQGRESHPTGIREQHPDKRYLGNDLRRMRIGLEMHQLEALGHDEADGDEENRRRDGRRPSGDDSPREYRRKDQRKRGNVHRYVPTFDRPRLSLALAGHILQSTMADFTSAGSQLRIARRRSA